jgi:hypothetical protein
MNRRSVLWGAAAAAAGLAGSGARDILLAPATASASESAAFTFATTLGAPTLVPIPQNPVRYRSNDSTFPYLPNSQGTANITFWVDGIVYRSVGQSLATMGPINPTTAVLRGTAGTFDGNGTWLFAAQRPYSPSGVIYGFYHAEDHVFADGTYGEWNTTGLATSTDDGVTWVKKGVIIGSPKPLSGAFGGREANSVIYDKARSRWLGIGHGIGYVSTDRNAAPGTWKGWYQGSFSVPMPLTASQPLDTLPGLSNNMANNHITWNTYLKRFVMVWQQWGQGRALQITTSADGVHWDQSQTLLSIAPPEQDGDPTSVGYAQIIGASSSESGRDATLVYEQWPSTTERQRDMIQRPLRFTLTGVGRRR